MSENFKKPVLTRRQAEVACGWAAGRSYQELSHDFNVSKATIQKHVQKAQRACGEGMSREDFFQFLSEPGAYVLSGGGPDTYVGAYAVVKARAEGLTVGQAAEHFSLSKKTVNAHVSSFMRKMNCDNSSILFNLINTLSEKDFMTALAHKKAPGVENDDYRFFMVWYGARIAAGEPVDLAVMAGEMNTDQLECLYMFDSAFKESGAKNMRQFSALALEIYEEQKKFIVSPRFPGPGL